MFNLAGFIIEQLKLDWLSQNISRQIYLIMYSLNFKWQILLLLQATCLNPQDLLALTFYVNWIHKPCHLHLAWTHQPHSFFHSLEQCVVVWGMARFATFYVFFTHVSLCKEIPPVNIFFFCNKSLTQCLITPRLPWHPHVVGQGWFGYWHFCTEKGCVDWIEIERKHLFFSLLLFTLLLMFYTKCNLKAEPHLIQTNTSKS